MQKEKKSKRTDNRTTKSYKSNKKQHGGNKNNNPHNHDNPEQGAYADKNHAWWYFANPQMAKDAASMSFANPIGLPLDYTGGPSDYSEIIPGICRINTLGVPGIMDGVNSPYNVASRLVLSEITKASGRPTNYDAPDVGLYLLAMDNCFSVWSWMVRIYGTAIQFNQENRYVPEALLKAMGVNPTSIAANLSNFRWYINQYAQQLSTLFVPRIMNYFTRHAYIYQNVFKDTASAKSQLYLFNPVGFHTYNETSGAGLLEFRALEDISEQLTYEQLISYVDQFLEPIMLSQDISFIGRDIKRAYQDNLFVWPMIPETFTVEPIFDMDVLTQIHNATVFPSYQEGNWTQLDITHSSDVLSLVFSPRFTAGNGYSLTHEFDLPFNNPTSEQIMEATRNMANADVITLDDNDTVYRVTSCGAEIIMGLDIISFDSTTTGGAIAINGFQSNLNYGVDIATTSLWTFIRRMSRLTKFDWHPLVRVFQYYSVENWIHYGTFGLIDNVTTLEQTQLQKMNYTAMMSLFSIPSIV